MLGSELEVHVMKVSGNTILITGGATGIGLALAEAFVDLGNRVVICGRRRNKLLVAKKQNPQLEIRVCDVSRSASRTGLVRWMEQRFPLLNILVNNAGIQRRFDFSKGTRDLRQVDQEIATNLVAPIHLTALLFPLLRKQNRAAIVNISSGLGFTPLAAVPVYCATKAAIHSLSLSLRHQLRGSRVSVFEIVPPMVATELAGRRQRPEDEYVMSSDAVAREIVRAIETETYEVPLGAAVNLYEKRDQMFSVINE
jgi:uncharacterized oxidoreductase